MSSTDMLENWEANVKDFSKSLLVMEGYKSQISKDMNMCLLLFSMELNQLTTSLVFFQCLMFVAVSRHKQFFSTSCLLTFPSYTHKSFEAPMRLSR